MKNVDAMPTQVARQTELLPERPWRVQRANRVLAHGPLTFGFGQQIAPFPKAHEAGLERARIETPHQIDAEPLRPAQLEARKAGPDLDSPHAGCHGWFSLIDAAATASPLK
jgi:hypothetical protein